MLDHWSRGYFDFLEEYKKDYVALIDNRIQLKPCKYLVFLNMALNWTPLVCWLAIDQILNPPNCCSYCIRLLRIFLCSMHGLCMLSLFSSYSVGTWKRWPSLCMLFCRILDLHLPWVLIRELLCSLSKNKIFYIFSSQFLI